MTIKFDQLVEETLHWFKEDNAKKQPPEKKLKDNWDKTFEALDALEADVLIGLVETIDELKLSSLKGKKLNYDQVKKIYDHISENDFQTVLKLAKATLKNKS